ncbi:MAG: 4Fe-4S dicluster domain-containing protein [Candidatus Bathyarchaeota archaeon]|nr:MAG: 4Fe-4S dicluster domain-containing protein [Candidatus Bathyarchaeota archaeon]
MILLADPGKCTGCKLCEIACSIKNEKTHSPASSRIHAVKWMRSGIYIPMVCQQCDSPTCETVCPMDAIKRDEETGAMVIDYDRCIGCRMCVVFCPFGGAGIDAAHGRVIKCDLCRGDPVCVKFCSPEALLYIPATSVNLLKQRNAAERFSELMKKMLTPP